MTAAQYVRGVGHVFAYLYTLDDDSEHPMDYETSLLPKDCPLFCLPSINNSTNNNMLIIMSGENMTSNSLYQYNGIYTKAQTENHIADYEVSVHVSCSSLIKNISFSKIYF